MSEVRLAIVIHAEEEFDWNRGFYRSNTTVTHADSLIEIVDDIIELGGKVTLAMDYPFVTSEGGCKVVEHYKYVSGDKVEFAAHQHPWVCPPFENSHDEVPAEYSYPGNLTKEQEYAKLKVLTDAIEKATGTRPKTYLAGRYGIGPNTQSILKELAYNMDLSISAYCDFSRQNGPDFSHYSNKRFCDSHITYFPHTSSIISLFPWVSRYLNNRPELFTKIQASLITRLVGKLMRIKRYRLSPEGFTFSQMKQVTESQINIGQTDFLLSFHSPSSTAKLTPYVMHGDDLLKFKQTIADYITWFNELDNTEIVRPQDMIGSNR
ncbi:hypothetical protein [Vibrio ziniensis]|uniref:WalW protein n=1 Tax=Vibrio ziniensis TaxID=2711221 RepID=A0A6G7CMG7_9VIBR|nr:hypothetical protein [Vibrio ziniensis]QIH43302.1 hypothetical protein G5S32_14950 [Vibrio ziniensis]